MSKRLNEEQLVDFGDDALAEISETMRAEANVLQHNAGVARFELTRRLMERDATHVETENWTGKLVPWLASPDLASRDSESDRGSGSEGGRE